jgi:hypothetical protein
MALLELCVKRTVKLSSRGFASEAGNASNPILFEPMVMSVLLAQQKRILALEKKLGIKQQVAGIPEPEQSQEN